MSIASELSALNGYILGAYDEINDKGGTVPANKNMANLASAIASISGGGGGGGSFASGIITTAGEKTYTIQHNLGVLPKLFACITTNANAFTSSANSYGSKFYICLTHATSSDGNNFLCQTMGNNSPTYYYNVTDASLATATNANGYYFNMDGTTATIKSGYSTSKTLGTDQTYYWVAVGSFE